MSPVFDISIVIPCYYNELNIPDLTKELVLNESRFDKKLNFEYVFVDDGSKDNTYQALLDFQKQYPDNVTLVKLVKNVGSYNAIVAGLSEARGECIVVISADLQDPPSLIPKMYSHFEKGYKLVVANRSKRNDSFVGDFFSNAYHGLIRRFALKNLPKGGFDFVLFHSDLKDHLLELNEKNTNCLYMLMWLGYDYVSVPYERLEREKGKSMWTFSKKVKLFIDSFISFSFLPVRLMVYSGVFLAMIGFLYAISIIVLKITGEIEIPGWTTIMILIIFISSIQMIFLGIIGEYLWRIFDEVRKRPNYIKEKVIKNDKE